MTVCVHGLGYIGLPTAAVLANAGHDVVGYDTNPSVFDRIDRGAGSIDEPGLREFVEAVRSTGALTFSADPAPADYHLVCVPTPLEDGSNRADLSAVEAAARTIAPLLRDGDAVIVESTVPPRTTVEVVRPILEAGVADRSFRLAHCPETVLPGRILEELRTNDRIVGGIDDASTAVAVELYDSFVEGTIHRAPDATTAEFVKLLQNTYRDVNIALANETAKLAADYGVDSRDAISLANSHPRVDVHRPGPGVGGHCIPIDPWFLGQGSSSLDLIAHARRLNDGMADYVVDRLLDRFDGESLRKVAVLGVAYKGNVDDYRESPGLALARALGSRSAEVPAAATTDETGPQVANGGSSIDVAITDAHVDDETLGLVSLDRALEGADAVIVATDHDEYAALDPTTVSDAMAGRFVLDTTGTLDREAWRAAGVTLERL